MCETDESVTQCAIEHQKVEMNDLVYVEWGVKPQTQLIFTC